MGLLTDPLTDPTGAAEQRGLLALAAGLLGTPGSFGRGLSAAIPGALGAYDSTIQQAAAQRLATAQLADISSQAALRGAQADEIRRRQALLAPLFAKLTGTPQASAGGAASQALAEGAASGSVGPTAANAARMQQPATAGRGGIGGLDPTDLAAAKLGGLPDLTDVWKLQQPTWQNINGFMVDTNAASNPGFRGGFQPGMQVSQDGKASLTTIGADGMPRVSAPAGALSTYSAYKEADAAAKPMQVYDPATGGMVWRTEGDVIRAAQPKVTPQQIRADMADPTTQYSSPAARAAAYAASGIPLQVAPTSAQARETALAQGLNEAQVKAIVESADKATAAADAVATVQRAREAMASGRILAGPGTRFGMLASQLGSYLGLPTDDALVRTREVMNGLAQLALSARGQMRGQGAISDREQSMLTRASTADVDSMTRDEIGAVLRIVERVSRAQIENHNDLLRRASSGDPLSAFRIDGTSRAATIGSSTTTPDMRATPQQAVQPGAAATPAASDLAALAQAELARRQRARATSGSW